MVKENSSKNIYTVYANFYTSYDLEKIMMQEIWFHPLDGFSEWIEKENVYLEIPVRYLYEQKKLLK